MNAPASPLLHADGTALHRQVFIVLHDQIARGERMPGSALPTEEALCAQFGVSRVTVRRALADLEMHGYVQRRHGRGTFVREQIAAWPPMSLERAAGLLAAEAAVQVEVLAVRTEPPPGPVRTLLQLAPAEAAVHALWLARAGATPLMVADAWVPERLGRKVTEAALKKKPLHRLLQAQGVQFGRVIQEFGAEAADPARAALLQTAISAPLIRLTRLLHDAQRRPVEHLTLHLSPERSRVLMEVESDAVDTLGAGRITHDPRAVGR